jgi:hypothetical protein
MLTMIGLQVLIWGLTMGDVINNWHFVIFTAANLLLVPPVGGALLKSRAMKKAGVEPETPPELVGVDRPFTVQDRLAMEHALGLDAVAVPVPASYEREQANAPA